MEFWNYLLLCSSFGTIIEIGETEKIIACENNNLRLDCYNGNNIYVCEANYGRLKPGSYDKCDPQNRDSNQNCRHASSLQIVRGTCQGLSSCSFKVTNTLFRLDPCGGTFKYLEVNYTCTTGSQTPTSCDKIITTTEDVIITTLKQTTEGTTTTKTTLPQTTQDERTIQTSEQTTKNSTIEDTSTTTTQSKTHEQTTEYETTSMGPATTTTTTKDASTDDTTQVNADKTTSLEPQCQCTCVEQNITLEEKLNNIKKELVVKKSTLSSRRRKLISAGDNRTSATQIGLIGATFLGVFLFMFIAGDLLNVLIFMYKNVFVKIFRIKYDKMESK